MSDETQSPVREQAEPVLTLDERVTLLKMLLQLNEGVPSARQVGAHLVCLGALSTISDESRAYVVQLLHIALPLIDAGRFEADLLK